MEIKTELSEMEIPFFLIRENDSTLKEITKNEWEAFVADSKYFDPHPDIPNVSIWRPNRADYLVHIDGKLITNMPSQEFVLFLQELSPKFQARLKLWDGKYFSNEKEDHHYDETDDFWFSVVKHDSKLRKSNKQKISIIHKLDNFNFLMGLFYVVSACSVVYLLIKWFKII
ncbi:MAG: hypothetical protein PVG66_02470 [Chromatiales bacterium]|jgi:hypothetical protein